MMGMSSITSVLAGARGHQTVSLQSVNLVDVTTHDSSRFTGAALGPSSPYPHAQANTTLYLGLKHFQGHGFLSRGNF